MWLIQDSSELHKSYLGGFNAKVMAYFWSPLDAVGNYVGLKKDNDSLATVNTVLMQRLYQAQSDTTGESTTWARRGFNFEFMPASIVSRSFRSQHNYAVIDRGWADGVQEGDGVITPKGVVGIVQGTSANFSRIITFTNPKMYISAKLGLDGFVGNLEWNGKRSDKGILSGIPLHAVCEAGDTVYTSGHSAIFPSDIPIAVVENISIHDGSYNNINVQMLEDSERVNYVMVVRNGDREEVEDLL